MKTTKTQERNELCYAHTMNLYARDIEYGTLSEVEKSIFNKYWDTLDIEIYGKQKKKVYIRRNGVLVATNDQGIFALEPNDGKSLNTWLVRKALGK